MSLQTKIIPNNGESFVIKSLIQNNHVLVNSHSVTINNGSGYRTNDGQLYLGIITTAPNTERHIDQIIRFATREEAENFKNRLNLGDNYRVGKAKRSENYPTEFVDLPIKTSELRGAEIILFPTPIRVYRRLTTAIKKQLSDTYPHLKYSAFDNSNVVGSFSLNNFPPDISFKYVLNSATLYTVRINVHGGLYQYPLVVNQGRAVNISQDPPELPFFGLTTYEDAQEFGNYFMQLLKEKKPLFFSQNGHPENNPTVEIRPSNMTEELNCTIIKLGVNLPELAATNHSEGYHSIKLPAYYLFQVPNVLTNFAEVRSRLSSYERNFFWFVSPYVWQDEYLKRFFTYKTKFNFSEQEEIMDNKENLEEAKLVPADNEEQAEPTEYELSDNEEQAMKDYQAEQERKRKETEERRRKVSLSRTLFDFSYDAEQPEDIFDDVTESLRNEYNSVDDDDDNISVKF